MRVLHMLARCKIPSVVLVALLLPACNRSKPASGVTGVHADRQITGQSKYPAAVNPARVGTYPPNAKSGAGYFYDEVLEYRVWIETGATQLNGGNDYFMAFAQYETAERFSKITPDAEPPLALVRQLEWIDEPERGHFIPKKEERIAEWQVGWLPGHKRTPNSIEEFMKHPQEGGAP
jgi:putative acetyltransferase